MRQRLQCLAVILVLVSVSFQRASAQQNAGVGVLQIPAGWTANGGPITSSIRLGDELVAREAGELQLSCPGDVVLVYSCRSQTCRARACEAKGEGMQIRQLGLIAGIGSWLSALGEREPIRPVIAAARAGGNPSDAVVVQDARGVHWGPALTRVLEGRSCFRLTSLPKGASSQIANFVLDWDRTLDPEGVSRAANVPPGLYGLEKGEPESGGRCQFDPDGSTAWVLVASTADFVRLNAEWKRQLSSIGELEQSGASVPALTTIRHAGLAHLARSFPRR